MILDEMRDRLGALGPTRLDVLDESAQHRGHAGWGGEEVVTHVRVRMTAPGFAGMSRLARHRAVHAALGDLVPRIHALALELD